MELCLPSLSNSLSLGCHTPVANERLGVLCQKQVIPFAIKALKTTQDQGELWEGKIRALCEAGAL